MAPGQPDHYLDGAQLRRFEVIEELIRVKDKDAPSGYCEERMNVRTTVRGPIISGPLLGYEGELVLSLRMASAELPGGAIGLDRLLTARRVADVDLAAQAIDVTYFNFVFVDKAGGISHLSTERVPIRVGSSGSHPRPVQAADDWRGFIPPSKCLARKRRRATGWARPTMTQGLMVMPTSTRHSSLPATAFVE